MAKLEVTSAVSQFMFFVGALLFLMGIYGFIRIIYVSSRSVPYPAQGVYPATILFPSNQLFSTYGRESECEPLPQVYYDYSLDGKSTPRQPSEEEKANEEKITKRCIQGFEEDRAKQAQRDRNQAAFMVFVGAGLILAKKYIDRDLV